MTFQRIYRQETRIAIRDFWFYSWLKKEPLLGFLYLFVTILAFKKKKIQLLLQQIFFLKSQNRFILPAIVWFVLTTTLLVLPLPVVPKETWFIKIPLFDKWVHIGLFITLTVLCCWGFYKKKKMSEKLKHSFILIGLGCVIYGIVMEFIQKYFVPNRSFDAGDILADGVGATLGSLYSIKRFIKK